jgi:hypothetical protein
MRRKSRKRLKLILIFMIACIFTGFLITHKFNNPSKEASTPWIVQDASNPSKRFITHDTIVNELQNKQELIPLELDLTEKVTISDNWGSADVFKKFQNVYLVAKGIYTIDLMQITSENVHINDNKKSLTINAPKPQVKAITIDEQKTLYETTQNGLFRFGDIKITAAEHQSILAKAKEKMDEKMCSSILYEEALKSSELSIKNFVIAVLGRESNYNITVEFN